MKTIILSPRCSGKSTYITANKDAICGEFLSTKFNIVKGFKMGAHGALVPTFHPYYKNWDDIHKIGVEKFWESDEFKDKYLIFNGGGILDWIKKIYFWDCGSNNIIVPQEKIDLKIVLIDKKIHYDYFIKRMKQDKRYDLSLKEILIKDMDFIYGITNWKHIDSERTIYKNLSKTYNIPVFNSFEEACK
jgi:hypothetical protein|tara:strand:+ start:3207 stop:3773 length:567 start_codon:yes stop_codon:yes gene_type:complete